MRRHVSQHGASELLVTPDNGCNAYSVSDTRKQRDVIEFLRCAIRSIMTGSATRFHKDNPTAGKTDSAVEAMAKAALQGDANDTIFQYEASTDDNPSPMLEKIQAPLFASNSADDEINPPELGMLEREIRRVRRGRYILIPLADQTSDLQPCGALEESSSRAAGHLRAPQLI